MEKKEFVKGMSLLGTAYQKKFDEEELTTWYMFLKEYQYGEFLEAITHLVKTQKYLPTISEICEAISIDDVSEAEYQFENVREAIRTYGVYRQRELMGSLDSYTKEILNLIGGISRVIMATPDQITWLRKEFVAEYKANKRNVPLLERANTLQIEEKLKREG